MSKFQYTHFGDEVPKEVEKEYEQTTNVSD